MTQTFSVFTILTIFLFLKSPETPETNVVRAWKRSIECGIGGRGGTKLQSRSFGGNLLRNGSESSHDKATIIFEFCLNTWINVFTWGNIYPSES